ncbi:MAG: FAD-dependent oxidoreductase [Betaproteobacteria bacterium]|jgi:rubredoxin-NAD+ reductase
MDPIYIIGTGLAGYNLAKEIRKTDKDTPLTLISADSGYFYSKPMLSNALAAKKPPTAIALNTPEQMATQINATVFPKTRVTAINPKDNTLQIGDKTYPYSRLVLALGADQIQLPIKGEGAKHVISVNDLDDYGQFHAMLEGTKTVVIIGAGLIGSEFANDLRHAGHEVRVIDVSAHPLGRLLPPEAGDLIRQKLEALGVQWHLGTSVNAIQIENEKLRVELTNGHTLEADIVLSAVGLKPRTQLAQAAGLSVQRGICVNRQLQTSQANIYALGDCMEIEGMVLPYVMPIMHAVRALAATLTGKPTNVVFPAMPVMVKTPACPTIVSPPAMNHVGHWHIEPSETGMKSLFKDSEGRLLGFALQGSATAERAKLATELPAVLPAIT